MQKNLQQNQDEYLKAFEEFSDGIFRHCLYRVSNREVSRDLTQETFLKVWQYIVSGGEILNMKAFLYKTANNLVIDYYRKKKSDSLDVLQEDGFDPIGDSDIEIVQGAEVSQALAILQKLSEDDREILVFRFVDGLSITEIADTLGETENVVSVRIHRALQKAKNIFKP